MTHDSNQPSTETNATLTALRTAVKNTLDRKKRLGQYAVVWRDGKPVLLDEEVEDRAAFYEAMGRESGRMSDAKAADDPQAGVADIQGRYRSDDE